MSENSYPTMPLYAANDIPDIFRVGSERIAKPEQWSICAQHWREQIVDIAFGGMPPQPISVEWELHCQNNIKAFEGAPRIWSIRVRCLGGVQPFCFSIKLLMPQSDEPLPVIINGDACWWRMDDISEAVVKENIALLYFDRTELAHDLMPEADRRLERNGGLYDIYPEHDFSAISAWAWAYHRCVDVLQEIKDIDASKIAVTGHSRGGKTALLAGLTDERIAMVNDNAGGTAGSAPYRYQGDGAEPLRHITRLFPFWFGSQLSNYVDNVEDLPFDQHCFLAAIAPRPLLLTYSYDDRWANPEGVVNSYLAAREAYVFLNCENKIAFHFREGPHAHWLEDWKVLLAFINQHWRGAESLAALNKHHFSHLKPFHKWSAP